ncbi:MAG: FKBP-type peptidyl-prolyl cis-trans isomerase [Chloroflexota bacterium]
MSSRSDRARRRAAKIRNQRIALIVIGVLLLAAGGYFAFTRLQPQDSAATAPAAAGLPNLDNLTPAGSGLELRDDVVGTGAEATAGKTVTVHYTGWLRSDGTKFDSSAGGQPFSFTLGSGGVIEGWEMGVAGMKVGGKRLLVIPPELGYGPNDYGPIPGGSTLIFEVELLDVK